jgi:hypothetical protein
MQAALHSGGEVVAVGCDDPRLAEVMREGADGQLAQLDRAPTISVSVERDRSPFTTSGWCALARGAWHRNGAVVVRDVCTSGLDLHVTVGGDVPEFVFRWRPPSTTRAAAAVLHARARLLARCVLLQYPVLWWAGTRERVPLHASLLQMPSVDVLVGGASGVGKSTLVASALAAGASASTDNLCVTDGQTAWGVVEPLRLDTGAGRRMPHGRREERIARRVPSVSPAVVALMRRGVDGNSSVSQLDARAAGRALAAGTYAAGELRRYWPFAALIAMGTGVGPVHPPVAAVARVLVDRTSTLDVVVGNGDAFQVSHLLEATEASPA